MGASVQHSRAEVAPAKNQPKADHHNCNESNNTAQNGNAEMPRNGRRGYERLGYGGCILLAYGGDETVAPLRQCLNKSGRLGIVAQGCTNLPNGEVQAL